jgi:hypothetical protein
MAYKNAGASITTSQLDNAIEKPVWHNMELDIN